MKTANTWTIRSVMGKILLGLVLAVMIGSIDVVPAFSRDEHQNVGKHDDKRMGNHDNGRYEHRRADYDRDRYGRRDYRPYGYAPPPVIYAPTPLPGIGIFFPPIRIPVPRR
jgi:hypothetical protein